MERREKYLFSFYIYFFLFIYLNNRMLNNRADFLPYFSKITSPCPKCHNVSEEIMSFSLSFISQIALTSHFQNFIIPQKTL